MQTNFERALHDDSTIREIMFSGSVLHEKLSKLLYYLFVVKCGVDQKKYHILGSYGMRGLREISDLDVNVDDVEFAKLKKLVDSKFGVFDVHNNQDRWFLDTDYEFKSTKIHLEIEAFKVHGDKGVPNDDFSANKLESSGLTTDDVGNRCYTLETVLAWKTAMFKEKKREKDIKDINTINRAFEDKITEFSFIQHDKINPTKISGLNDRNISLLFDDVCKKMDSLKDGAHTCNHIIKVYNRCMEIAKSEFILSSYTRRLSYVIGIVHDLEDRKLNSPYDTIQTIEKYITGCGKLAKNLVDRLSFSKRLEKFKRLSLIDDFEIDKLEITGIDRDNEYALEIARDADIGDAIYGNVHERYLASREKDNQLKTTLAAIDEDDITLKSLERDWKHTNIDFSIEEYKDSIKFNKSLVGVVIKRSIGLYRILYFKKSRDLAEKEIPEIIKNLRIIYNGFKNKSCLEYLNSIKK